MFEANVIDGVMIVIIIITVGDCFGVVHYASGYHSVGTVLSRCSGYIWQWKQ